MKQMNEKTNWGPRGAVGLVSGCKPFRTFGFSKGQLTLYDISGRTRARKEIHTRGKRAF